MAPSQRRASSRSARGSYHPFNSTTGDDDEEEDPQTAREVKLIKICIAVSFTFMLVEIVVGYQFQCLALVADSFHMLNDVAAFLVQLYARQIGSLKRPHTRETTGFSYGFARTQFIANLVNGSLLLALCLTLALESLQRLYAPEVVLMPPIIVIVAGLALLWNIMNFFWFGGTGHSHDGHSHDGHSHNEHSHDAHSLSHSGPTHPSTYRRAVIAAGISSRFDLHNALRQRKSRRVDEDNVHHEHALSKNSFSRRKEGADSNASAAEAHAADAQDVTVKEPMSALAAHAFADATGNVAVILDGLATWLFGPRSGWVSGVVKTWKGIVFVDPLASLVVCWIIVKHAFPLVTASSYALMQATPPADAKALRALLSRSSDFLPSHLASDYAVKCQDVRLWELTKGVMMVTVRVKVLPTSRHNPQSPFDGGALAELVSTMKQAIGRQLASKPRPGNITIEVDYEDPSAADTQRSPVRSRSLRRLSVSRNRSGTRRVTDPAHYQREDYGSPPSSENSGETSDSDGDLHRRQANALLQHPQTRAAASVIRGQGSGRVGGPRR